MNSQNTILQRICAVCGAAAMLWMSAAPVGADPDDGMEETTTTAVTTTLPDGADPAAETTSTESTETSTEETTTTTTTTAPPEHTDQLTRFEYEEQPDGTLTITRFQWETDEETVIVPDQFEGKTVTAIGDNAFKYCYASSVELPATVKRIGDNAFAGCAWLTAMNIPEACTAIGSGAFSGCDKLAVVNIPASVNEIGTAAFDGTPFITTQAAETVILGDGILYTYSGSDSELVIPDTVKVIAANACSGHKALKKVTIPSSVRSIGSSAFADCEALAEVEGPDRLEILAPDAFVGTKWFDSAKEDFLCLGSLLVKYSGKDTVAEIPQNVRVINEKAFAGNAAVTTVKMPGNVEEIRRSAFEGCTSLQVVTCADTLRTIGENAFRGCETLKYLRLGHSLSEIGDYAFVGCTYLEEVYLPDSLYSIGAKALGFKYNEDGEKYIKIRNSLVMYANNAAARKYAEAEDITLEPLPAEENTDTPPEVTTVEGERAAIGTPRGTAWIPALILGGALLLFGIIAYFVRRKKR